MKDHALKVTNINITFTTASSKNCTDLLWFLILLSYTLLVWFVSESLFLLIPCFADVTSFVWFVMPLHEQVNLKVITCV